MTIVIAVPPAPSDLNGVPAWVTWRSSICVSEIDPAPVVNALVLTVACSRRGVGILLCAERNCADQTCALTLARLFPRTIQNNPTPILNRITRVSSTWGAPKGNRGNHAGDCCED